ncbi:MAG: PQQ-binding-like beta-propeller repeat protein [Planctomycetaceae bacterium]|nr:PQQ-binding-like beta-propeller repeat protein [Planctomycetaceae bacterium]
MPHLQIKLPDDGVRTVELDKRAPLSIGQHPSNDVCIDGDDVELMHCRVSYSKKTGIEVIAAGIDGVDINGTLVQKAVLEPGDVLRIGEANITLVSEDAGTTKAPQQDDAGPGTFGLRPLTAEFDSPDVKNPNEPLTADEIISEDDPLTADEIITDDDESDRQRRKKKRSKERVKSDDRKQRRKSRSDAGADADDDWPNLTPEELSGVDPRDARVQDAKRPVSPKTEDDSDAGSATESIPPRRHQRHLRPGERDPVRSPLVLSLGGGAAILALVGLTFWFILSRQSTQQDFDKALALMEEGKYNDAIKGFEEFLIVHPRDPLADDAQVNLWVSRIDRQIGGASPNWAEGLKELEGFINARRDAEGFDEQQGMIRERAEQIAEGAAVAAGKVYDRSLLDVADSAQSILERYQTEDAATSALLKRIETARRVSLAAILKYEALTDALAAMEAALQRKSPLEALVTRRELLSRYPEFTNDSKVVAKLATTLTAERDAVSERVETIDAVTDEHPTAFPPALVLTFHARSRTDEVSVGRTVFGIVKDSCYAVDNITGEPVWRRVIGWDTPFFPVPISTTVSALLVFDTNHDELVCVDQQSGALLWRQPAIQAVSGPPLIDEGQAYVVGASGTLSKLDLESGQVISQLTFSQPLLSPPAVLNDDARIVVCGDQEVVYTLTKRPFACAAVSHLGQAPESVAAPVLPMGALVMVAENLPEDQSQLHVLDTRNEGDKLTEAAALAIPGHVVDPPVIRGRDVFVPSTGERVTSFSATDEKGQPPLTEGARYESEGATRSPMFLATGPDRQVWMASRNLRKLQLLADAIEADARILELGIATQPLQQIGKQIYVGSRRPYTGAMTLFQADRDQLTSEWQVVLGGEILSFGTLPNQDGLIAVSESGDVFRVSDSQMQTGGFLTNSTVRIKLPDGLTTPLGATQTESGRVDVWCGDPAPQMWVINRLGQVERNFPLPGLLDAAPTRMGKFIALPLPDRVHLISQDGSPSKVQDFSLPHSDTVQSRWREVATIDETSLVAVADSGQLHLLRLQESPQPFLNEAGNFDLGAAIDFDVAVVNGQIAAAVGDRLTLMDAATLEPTGDTQLEGPVSNDVWIAGPMVFAEVNGTKLVCFAIENGLTQKWAVNLEQTSLAGSPVVQGDAVVVARKDGMLMNIDANTGEVKSRQTIGQALGSGPRETSSELMVATSDGGIVRITSILNSP